MAGSTFGKFFRITTWGESHGKAMGVVVDGVPAGLPLCEADIQPLLDRRKPGRTAISTPRQEEDGVEILSGTFEGLTTGMPISLIIRNLRQISKDYSHIAHYYRPGHADHSFDAKYGFRDYRGGGRSSGRETTGRVAAGAIAKKILSHLGIEVEAYTLSLGTVRIDPSRFDPEYRLQAPTAMPDPQADQAAQELLAAAMAQHDSLGGVIECRILGAPAGLGEPVFDKLDAELARAMMSIGAVKAVEIGDGIQVTGRRGSENNDAYSISQGRMIKKTNHAGGILGGISDGDAIILRAHVKPTSSIFKEQETVTQDGRPIKVQTIGRHDPVIVPRAVVVVEAMAALTLADALLANMGSRMEYLENMYRR